MVNSEKIIETPKEVTLVDYSYLQKRYTHLPKDFPEHDELMNFKTSSKARNAYMLILQAADKMLDKEGVIVEQLLNFTNLSNARREDDTVVEPEFYTTRNDYVRKSYNLIFGQIIKGKEVELDLEVIKQKKEKLKIGIKDELLQMRITQNQTDGIDYSDLLKIRAQKLEWEMNHLGRSGLTYMVHGDNFPIRLIDEDDLTEIGDKLLDIYVQNLAELQYKTELITEYFIERSKSANAFHRMVNFLKKQFNPESVVLGDKTREIIVGQAFQSYNNFASQFIGLVHGLAIETSPEFIRKMTLTQAASYSEYDNAKKDLVKKRVIAKCAFTGPLMIIIPKIMQEMKAAWLDFQENS